MSLAQVGKEDQIYIKSILKFSYDHLVSSLSQSLSHSLSLFLTLTYVINFCLWLHLFVPTYVTFLNLSNYNSLFFLSLCLSSSYFYLFSVFWSRVRISSFPLSCKRRFQKSNKNLLFRYCFNTVNYFLICFTQSQKEITKANYAVC